MPVPPEVSLKASTRAANSLSGDALVLGVFSDKSGPKVLNSPLSAELTTSLEATLKLLGATGAADELRRIPALESVTAKSLALIGLGKLPDASSVTTETLRRAAGSVVRQLAGCEHVILALPADTSDRVRALAEGVGFGSYRPGGYVSPTKPSSAADASEDSAKNPPSKATIISPLPSRVTTPLLEQATVIGRAVNLSRSLVNDPPNLLFPESFATAAKELGKGLPLKFTVWDEKRLEREGYGGIIGVGKGSTRQPRLVKIEYSPAKATKHLALVGKGITFDSGGLSLKPATAMTTMKLDMAGAAAILNATLAIAELGLALKVTSYLCLAENMPSGAAGRPSDVITIHGGKTVEVANTDAEGRLVLADGLVAASKLSPDVILDVATLTGAQMVALGNRTSGLMGEDSVVTAVKEAADTAGELFWPMPLPEELRPSLSSEVADLKNIGESMGGMMTAAVFLQEFIGESAPGVKIPWAHLDIAGPAFNEKTPYGYTPKQGTGVAVRTLVQYAQQLSAQ